MLYNSKVVFKLFMMHNIQLIDSFIVYNLQSLNLYNMVLIFYFITYQFLSVKKKNLDL